MRTKLSLLLLVLTAFAGTGAAQADEVARLKAELLEARRAEGKLLLEKMQLRVRVLYAKNGSIPKTVSNRDVRFDVVELAGTAYTVQDVVYSIRMEKGALIAEESKAGAGFGIVVFTWEKGDPKYHWYDTLKALKEAHKEFRFDGTGPVTDKGDKKDEEGEVDMWATWRKEGRNWTYKMAGGMKYTMTVKNVKEDSADLESQTYDAEGKAMGPAHTFTMKFENPQPAPGGRVEPPRKSIEKKVKCEAGEFDCISYDNGSMWLMKKYPGIVVKSEQVELIEFNE